MLSARTRNYKTFYVRNLRLFVISWSVCTGQATLNPGLMFVSKVRRLIKSGADGRCFTRVASRLGPKNWTRLEKLPKDNHSSLLPALVNYCRKRFYKIWPRNFSPTFARIVGFHFRLAQNVFFSPVFFLKFAQKCFSQICPEHLISPKLPKTFSSPKLPKNIYFT